MNLDEIQKQCFILALFIREDGERFLLGSGAYPFNKKQLHFVANSYQNDLVEVQGNDGIMLAGQVRRSATQPFDGYIGDATVSKQDIEQYRRQFFMFFRKNYYYKVVYIFSDGTAIQRQKGFIVDAPEVKELYQFYPDYHVAMNFEDINYYEYSEDSEGQEIFGKSATIPLSIGAQDGGVVWNNDTNLFDKDNPNVVNLSANVGTKKLQPSGATQSLYIPCEPNKTYIVKKAQTARFQVFTTENIPVANGDCLQVVYNFSATQLTITTDPTAQYLGVFFYNANYDTMTPEQIMDTIVITEGAPGAIWDNYGLVWEATSGSGYTTVMVDSIDFVYPIWEVVGPAVNPQFADLTSNMTLYYSGSVGEGQTLTIDMNNKTALLSGLNVVGNVSGDWVALKPGNNRISYTTDNNDAESSTIKWQEVVG